MNITYFRDFMAYSLVYIYWRFGRTYFRVYFSTPKVEAAHFVETSVNVYRTTRRCIREDSNALNLYFVSLSNSIKDFECNPKTTEIMK
jgi:hypothetical protein